MKKIKTIADLLRYISENSILLKTELNHIGIISISMILVTIFYAFSIDIGFGVINIILGGLLRSSHFLTIMKQGEK